MCALHEVEPTAFALLKKEVFEPICDFDAGLIPNLGIETGLRELTRHAELENARNALASWLASRNLFYGHVAQYLLLVFYDWATNPFPGQGYGPLDLNIKRSRLTAVYKKPSDDEAKLNTPQPPEVLFFESDEQHLEKYRRYLQEKRAWNNQQLRLCFEEAMGRLEESIQETNEKIYIPTGKQATEHYKWTALYQCCSKSLGEIAQLLSDDDRHEDQWTIYRAVVRTLKSAEIQPRKGLRGAKN
jgi:hypothetical protein